MTKHDFSICERIPLKHLGYIQSYSYVFVFELDSKNMLACSENVKEFNYKEFPFLDTLTTLPSNENFNKEKTLHSKVYLKKECFHLHTSRQGNIVFFEFEKFGEHSISESIGFAELQKAETIHQEYFLSTEEIWLDALLKLLNPFINADRSLVYKFDSDYSGKVICEQIANSKLDSYLGLYFPSTDIPKIVREMYSKSPTRFIFDANEVRTNLQNLVSSYSAESLDLTSLHGRGVNSFHTDYLKAMNIRTSFSVALNQGEHLWGLINFHFTNAVHLDFSLRDFVEKIGKSISYTLSVRNASYLMKIIDNLKDHIEDEVLESKNSKDSKFIDKLLPFLEKHLRINGLSIQIQNGTWQSAGVCPKPTNDFLKWLESKTELSTNFTTRSLMSFTDHSQKSFFSPTDTAGMLYTKIYHKQRQLGLMLFRSPLPETVQWAGKAIPPQIDPELPSPVRSFAIWAESRKYHSEDWTFSDRKYAWEIGKIILEQVELV